MCQLLRSLFANKLKRKFQTSFVTQLLLKANKKSKIEKTFFIFKVNSYFLSYMSPLSNKKRTKHTFSQLYLH